MCVQPALKSANKHLKTIISLYQTPCPTNSSINTAKSFLSYYKHFVSKYISCIGYLCQYVCITNLCHLELSFVMN